MRTDLLDVNLWLALADAQHVHHARARHYWEDEAMPRIAFCRISMLGLLRLGTNSKVMRGVPFSPVEIWQVYRAFRQLPEVVFIDEPSQLDTQLAAWSEREGFPAHAWTDCYLAAVALRSGCRVVSFDSDFSRFTGLDFLQLKQ
jgi:uncharacterized protein